MMLTGPRSITSSIATQYVFLSLHAAVLINHWTVAFTSCKIAFNGHHLLDKWIYLRLMYCLSTSIKNLPFVILSLSCVSCVSSWKGIIVLLVAFAGKLLIWFEMITMAMASTVYFVAHNNRLIWAISFMDIFEAFLKSEKCLFICSTWIEMIFSQFFWPCPNS